MPARGAGLNSSPCVPRWVAWACSRARSPPPVAGSLQGSWHVYAVRWTPEGYTFYLDGVAQWATSDGLSRRPEFIKLTCEVQDRRWAGRIPAGGYGSRGESRVGMQVDWVRVWQAER